MATEAVGGTVPANSAAEPKDQQKKPDGKDQKAQPKQPQAAGGAPAEGSGEKELTNAEKKKRAKEEKAARRAQAKTVQPSQPQGASGSSQAGASDAKGGKAKSKQDGQQQQQQQNAKSGARPGAPAMTVGPSVPKEMKPAIPDCFSHLSMARRIDLTHADKDVHPAVLVLGQHMNTFAVSDSISRLEATLLAFKKVIDSYTTPHGTTFSRHFTSHVLNPQIEYLTACRPMCFSMGNAIRWLKLQISKIDIDLPDSDAKKLLGESIDNFIRERITLADFVIVQTAAEMIEDDEIVLTYAHHNLVERALLQAKEDGKRFRVVLIDDPFERVGVEHAKRLAAAGIPVSYSSDLGALRIHLRSSTRVLVAAEAVFSNGAMYARAGTCDIATVATDMGVRVVALCQSINFTERVSIDSLTYNEIDPERSTVDGFRLLFDTTRDKFISVIVTELGNASATSVPSILRKLEEL